MKMFNFNFLHRRQNIHTKSYSLYINNSDITPFLDNYDEAIRKVAYVYRAVNIISTKIASVPFLIVNKKGNIQDNIIAKFTYANPVFSWHEIVQMTQAQIELNGYVIWDMSKNFINVLDSNYIMFRKENNQYEIYYNDPVTSTEVKLDRAKIAIFRNFIHRPSLTGLPTLCAAMNAANVVNMSGSLVVNLLRNGAVMPVYIKALTPLSEKQRKAIKDVWKKKYTATNFNGEIPVFPSNIQIEKLGLSPADLNLLAQIDKGKEQIAVVFGIPAIFLNDFKNAKYDSAESQERIFTQYTILPKLHAIETTINKFVLPLLGDNTSTFTFDIKSLPELSRQNLDTERKYDIMIKNGTMTINERRAIDNMPPVKWGDGWFGPANYVQLAENIKNDKSLNVLLTKMFKEEHDDNKNNIKRENIDKIKNKYIYKIFDIRRQSQEKKLTKEIKKILNKVNERNKSEIKNELIKKIKPYIFAFFRDVAEYEASELKIKFVMKDKHIDNINKNIKDYIDVIFSSENINEDRASNIAKNLTIWIDNYAIYVVAKQANIKHKAVIDKEGEIIAKANIDEVLNCNGVKQLYPGENIISNKGIYTLMFFKNT